MARTPRIILNKQVYEIVVRAKEGLPLPPTKTSNALIQGVMARAQRDQKVELSNFCWMSNHAHIMAVTKEPHQITNFYGETQKKLTESVKALLGRKNLLLWEGRASLLMLAELQDTIDRLVYIFCNPAAAGLCQTIEQYPGLSSWKAFCDCEAAVEAKIVVKTYWYPVKSIPKLPESKTLNEKSDKHLLQQMNSSAHKVEQELVIQPFIWLKQFGITKPDQIELIRREIIDAVKEKELQIKKHLESKKQKVFSPEALKQQPYMKSHTPKKKERKIFLICKNPMRRLELLRMFKEIVILCKEAYQRAKAGFKDTKWPDGTFIPWLPPNEGCCF